MLGSYVLLGDGLSAYVPWMLGNGWAPDYGEIKIGYVAVPPNLSHDDFDYIEDVHFHDDHPVLPRPNQVNFTHMNTEWESNVLIAPLNASSLVRVV
ncbi:hypothetical protein N7466_010069 [Penicillium verhagenii]|uniref:uncharacterized protein n=1 Tax=Penicillium verhagenii TaxID=1562060 RepID=UPI0025453D90|nr:uncharacterized protein N7466_010069 [Penicillium verhagenii]KAJ5919126.1 hypothetical protein N7466_010069 [Penicillium verhagenii]